MTTSEHQVLNSSPGKTFLKQGDQYRLDRKGSRWKEIPLWWVGTIAQGIHQFRRPIKKG